MVLYIVRLGPRRDGDDASLPSPKITPAPFAQ